jgi:hypothetical protein
MAANLALSRWQMLRLFASAVAAAALAPTLDRSAQAKKPGPSSIAITGAVPRESVGQGDRSARCGFFGESDEIYFKGGSSALITALVNAIHRHGAGLCPDDAPKDGKIVLGFDAPGARRLKISMS